MCEITYTGNNQVLDRATTESITINGATTSFPKTLDDLLGITGNIESALSSSSITAIDVLSTTYSQLSEINLNSGDISVFVQIFYPSTELTASLDILINGATQTFTFVKVPTA